MKRRVAEVVAEVAAKHGLTVEDLRGPSRKRPVAWPRQEAMYEAHVAGTSYPRIGWYLGERDHSTVITGARRHAERAAAAS